MAGIGFNDLMKKGDATPLTPASGPSKSAVETAALGASKAQQEMPQGNQTPEQQANNSGQWRALLRDPRIRAGFLQIAVNSMAGQGPGQAIGGGFAAVGRAEEGRVAEEERQRTADLEERALSLRARTAAQAAARRSGGGGGSSSSSRLVPGNLSITDWQKRLTENYGPTEADLINDVEASPGWSNGQIFEASQILHEAGQRGDNPGALLDAMAEDYNNAVLAWRITQDPSLAGSSDPAETPTEETPAADTAPVVPDVAETPEPTPTILPESLEDRTRLFAEQEAAENARVAAAAEAARIAEIDAAKTAAAPETRFGNALALIGEAKTYEDVLAALAEANLTPQELHQLMLSQPSLAPMIKEHLGID